MLTSQELEARVIETMAWCRKTIETKSDLSFRSSELKPQIELEWKGGSEPHGEDFSEWYLRNIAQMSSQVERIVLRRREFFGRAAIPAQTQPQGRLLLYSPFFATGDGLAGGDSAGFFDFHDSPPWDTYVCYWFDQNDAPDLTRPPYDDGVICWIPHSRVALADAGIRVSLGSLQWLHTSRMSPRLKSILGRFHVCVR